MLAAAVEVRGDRDAADTLLRASRALDDLPIGDRRTLVKALRRGGAPPSGWTPDASTRVSELLDRGIETSVATELSRLPADVAGLLRLPDLDPADLIRAHRRHAVLTASDIVAEALHDEARVHDDPDDAALRRLAQWVPTARGGRARLPLGRAVGVLEALEARLDDRRVYGRVVSLGSARRFEPTVGDLDVLLVHEAPEAALEAALARLGPEDEWHRSPRRAVIRWHQEEISLRACTPAEAGTLSLWHTGSGAHLRQLRRRGASLGVDVRPRGLRLGDGPLEPAAEEEDVYARLGLAFVPPELRHGTDDVERAAAGGWDGLVRVGDMRGDLHTHTLYSDGRDPVETMVQAARALGYEYIAITDHSPSAAASRTLTLDRLPLQVDDVARARARVPQVQVLHGVEVDILEDGRLDLPDEILDRMDIVLASLHEPHGHGPVQLLDRYLAAMRHPRVNIVTHPANRLVGRHDGYALDWDALFRAAVDTHTALEVDGGPGHLDMDGELARRAVAAGVTVTIDSDCHNALRLGRQMRLGVGTARRGAVEARQVLNTRPLAEVQAFFEAKRRRLADA